MSGRKNHGNNSKRFDVNSFYAYIKKAHINELLDADGNTPYDSDSIDRSVWEYAAYLYKDIQDYGGLLSYFDSETFRADSDGAGNNTWGSISKTDAVSQVYKPLRRWLYSLDSEEGINNTMDLITGGFNRRYYTLPLSDSEGTLRHVNVYTFLKSHFDRWLRFDPYERRKIASRVVDNLNEDSDVRYRFADQVIIALEEDSDLARRVTELVSNVLQTDSEVRNEILKTTVLGFQNDSDAARDLAKIIGNVLETDSDVRNEYADSILVSIKQDSDQQVELGRILSSHEFTELNSQVIYARQVLPMDSDDTGNIGDSDQRWALGNFTTVRTDDLKVRSLVKDRIVFISDSEGKLSTSYKLQWQNDSELVVDGNVVVTGITNSPTVQVTTLSKDRIVYITDSDGTLATSNKLQWHNDSELIVEGNVVVSGITNSSTVQVTTLSKDRLVYVSDSDGTLATSDKLQWQGDSELVVDGDINVLGSIDIPDMKITSLQKDRIVYVADADGTLATNSNLQWHKDSELIINGSLTMSNGLVDAGSATVRELSDVPGGLVFRNSTTGKLDVNSRLTYNDNDGLIYDGKAILPIDSDTLQSLLIENIDSEFSQYVGLDSDAVESIINQSTVLSEVAVPPGPKGNIYYIDSENTNILANGNLVTIGSGTDASVKASLPKGRMGHNTDTKKTFYNDGTVVHELGTARHFSDVIVMENLDSPPDSDQLGGEGLRPGTIAVADGVNWDPAGYAGATPYPVFWDGGQWLIFTLF